MTCRRSHTIRSSIDACDGHTYAFALDATPQDADPVLVAAPVPSRSRFDGETGGDLRGRAALRPRVAGAMPPSSWKVLRAIWCRQHHPHDRCDDADP